MIEVFRSDSLIKESLNDSTTSLSGGSDNIDSHNTDAPPQHPSINDHTKVHQTFLMLLCGGSMNFTMSTDSIAVIISWVVRESACT